jgi:hypothetical protein
MNVGIAMIDCQVLSTPVNSICTDTKSVRVISMTTLLEKLWMNSLVDNRPWSGRRFLNANPDVVPKSIGVEYWGLTDYCMIACTSEGDMYIGLRGKNCAIRSYGGRKFEMKT